MSIVRIALAAFVMLVAAPMSARAAASTCNDIFFCFEGEPCADSESFLGQMVGAVDGVGELLCFVGDPKCGCFQAITGDAVGERFDQWADKANEIIDVCGDSQGGGRSLAGIAVEAATNVCTPTFAADVQPILDASCAICHIDATSGGLNFGGGRADLVNVPSAQSSLDLIEPGDPEASYLFHKIRGTHQSVGGSGGRMPAGGTLSGDDEDVIEAWILGGARP